MTESRSDPLVNSTTSFVDYLTMTTPVWLAGASYIVFGTLVLSATDNNTDAGARMVFDGVPSLEIDHGVVSPGGAMLYDFHTVFEDRPSSGSIDMVAEFRRAGGGGSVSALMCRLTTWRVA